MHNNKVMNVGTWPCNFPFHAPTSLHAFCLAFTQHSIIPCTGFVRAGICAYAIVALPGVQPHLAYSPVQPSRQIMLNESTVPSSCSAILPPSVTAVPHTAPVLCLSLLSCLPTDNTRNQTDHTLHRSCRRTYCPSTATPVRNTQAKLA